MGRGMRRLFVFVTILYWVVAGAWIMDGAGGYWPEDDVSDDRLGFAFGVYAFAFGVGWTICGFLPRSRE